MVKMTVDAMGDHCPIPVVKTKKTLGKLQGAGQIEVLVDNETAMKKCHEDGKKQRRVSGIGKDQRPGIQSDDYGRREERGCIRKRSKRTDRRKRKAGRRQKVGGKKQANRITIRQQKMEVTVVRRG